MKPVEVVIVNSKQVSCDGTKDSSTHPLIYLNMGEKEGVVCPYCSKYFVLKGKEKSITLAKNLNN